MSSIKAVEDSVKKGIDLVYEYMRQPLGNLPPDDDYTDGEWRVMLRCQHIRGEDYVCDISCRLNRAEQFRVMTISSINDAQQNITLEVKRISYNGQVSFTPKQREYLQRRGFTQAGQSWVRNL